MPPSDVRPAYFRPEFDRVGSATAVSSRRARLFLQMRSRHWILGLAVVILGLTSPHRGGATTSPPTPAIEGGALDAGSYDFAHRPPIELSGLWEFYWQRLLRPGEASVPPTGYFPMPHLWNRQQVGDTPLSSQGYATYRLELQLPPDAPPLGLALEDVYTAYELWAGDALIARNGQVGSDAAATVPHWLPQVVDLPAADANGRLELTFIVANFDHHKGGPNQPMLLGAVDELRTAHAQAQMRSMFLTGCLVMGGLFFLGLYAFGSHDRSVLLFSLFCLVYSYRVGGTGLYALHALWPTLPWWLTVRLEFLAFFLSAYLLSRHLQLLYPADAQPFISNLINALTLSATATALALPTRWFTALATPGVFIIFPSLLYIMVVYVRAALNRRPGAIWGVMSMAVLVIVVAVGSVDYLQGRTSPVVFSFFGYIGFFFFHSLIHSFRFAHNLREAKERAERGARAKSDFLSMISHEIRTPLNGVIGLTNVLIDENPRPEQRDLLNSLKFSAHHLLGIINHLLDFNKIEAGKMELELRETDFTALARNLQSSLHPTAERKRLSFVVDIDPALPTQVLADPVRANQVLTNLSDNALKFTEQGAVTVSLRVAARTADAVTVDFEVKDTGIGIPPDKLEMIFEDFSQAHSSTSRLFGGTGLGLAICKRLLALQGVELQVESELGQGTRFFYTQTFALPEPLAEPHPGALIPPVATALPPSGTRVLLVEDNPINTTVAKRMLQRWNVAVDHATNGQEAVDLVERQRYDVVLMDLHMPVMDGLSAAREIRQRGITVPIIALTATTIENTTEKITAAGMNGLVTKPFSPELLLAELMAQLAASR